MCNIILNIKLWYFNMYKIKHIQNIRTIITMSKYYIHFGYVQLKLHVVLCITYMYIHSYNLYIISLWYNIISYNEYLYNHILYINM